jgi:hypothetical protein
LELRADSAGAHQAVPDGHQRRAVIAIRADSQHPMASRATPWHLQRVSATGAQPAASSISPVGADGPLGYAFEVQATEHAIYFSADDAHVREIWWGPPVTHSGFLPAGVAQAGGGAADVAPPVLTAAALKCNVDAAAVFRSDSVCSHARQDEDLPRVDRVRIGDVVHLGDQRV